MKTHTPTGFTLVEMAIVLALMALVLGVSLTVISTQLDQRRIDDTNALLSDARDALIGYALSHTASDGHPYLPCPDRMSGGSGSNVANDGVEDRTAGACDTQEGNLPWVTLGIAPQTDAWNNRLRYAVTAAFSNSLTGMQLTSAGNLNVNDAATGSPAVIVTAVPAIILSHGKNGSGAINATGNANAMPPATNTDETANTDLNTTFVSHTIAFSKDNAPGGEFDDQVSWLSPNILFNRMVQAGRLP